MEKWIPQARKRVDLFDAIDIVALDLPRKKTIGVQCSTGSSHAAHKAKILASERMLGWSACGNEILLITWSKKGPRGKRKIWEPRIEKISPSDFNQK